ncbi:MAG: hypothetical protein ACJ74O_03805 [Frankiaceae bacterium]
MSEIAPRLTESDQRAAIEQLTYEAASRGLSDEQVHRLTGAIWASNTPHELYRRTHGLLGDRHRRDAAQWVRIAAFWAAVVLLMVLVTWFTAMAARDGLFGQ